MDRPSGTGMSEFGELECEKLAGWDSTLALEQVGTPPTRSSGLWGETLRVEDSPCTLLLLGSLVWMPWDS
jgi:hypothetical protein